MQKDSNVLRRDWLVDRLNDIWTIDGYSPSTNPIFSFSALLLRAHSGGTSIPSSSSWSPCSFVLCTVVGLCSAGLYTVYRISGVGPVLMNWCCVPAGTMIKSPALTSWSLPAIVAFPLPDVNVRIWSTVCFCGVHELSVLAEEDADTLYGIELAVRDCVLAYLITNLSIHWHSHED